MQSYVESHYFVHLSYPDVAIQRGRCGGQRRRSRVCQIIPLSFFSKLICVFLLFSMPHGKRNHSKCKEQHISLAALGPKRTQVVKVTRFHFTQRLETF